jgi:hypothetical protein
MWQRHPELSRCRDPEISSTGPVRGRGFCPGSHCPRARVPLVVWAWDFLLCGFLVAVSRPPHGRIHPSPTHTSVRVLDKDL